VKEWITLIVFVFYGSWVAVQASSLLFELNGAAFHMTTAVEFLKCLVTMRPPKDSMGYWAFGWLLLWLPFAGAALFSLNRSLRFATLSYGWSAVGGAVLALFWIGIFFALGDPEIPSGPNQQSFIHTVLQITLSIVSAVLAATFVVNFLIRAAEALNGLWQPQH
jgi:hypothetical protein